MTKTSRTSPRHPRARAGFRFRAAAACLPLALVLAGCGTRDDDRQPAPVVQGDAAPVSPGGPPADPPAATAPPPPEEAGGGEAQVAALPPARPRPRRPALREEALEPAPRAALFSVGILLPLTGGHAAVGGAMLDAAELALFETGGERTVLVPRDTGGDPLRAAEAFAELRAAEAGVIVGPLFAPSVDQVAPAARAVGIPMLALTNDVSLAGDGVWALGRHPGDEVRRILAHARNEGRTRFGLLAPRTPYGEEVRAAFYGSLPANAVSGSFLYSPGGDAAAAVQQFLARASELAAAPDSAILVAARGRTLRALAAELAYLGVDRDRAVLLGLGGWHDPEILGEPALVDGKFAAPSREPFAGFAARYARIYGRPPPPAAALAYDAVSLALSLARIEEEEARLPALAAPEGFRGTLGLFRLLDAGSVERGLAVYRVDRNGFRPVEAAPERFGATARRGRR